ncbi:MAG: hypothetical protein NT031_00590, partial [Planctomycetota bacterium]|nr:hypothetical protein [Planctomycetota bacterium]
VEGDYKNPPPLGAWDTLHKESQASLKGSPIIIPASLRETVGRACLEQFAKEGAEVFCLSVGGQHVHVAFEGPSGDVRPMIGRVKKVSSHRIRTQMPGRVWAGGGKILRATDERHWANVLRYVTKQSGHAWCWAGATSARGVLPFLRAGRG